MNKLLAIYNGVLTKLGADKVQHFLFGMMFSVFVAGICAVFALSVQATFLVCWGASAALGAVKEALDLAANITAASAGLPAPHGVELWDALATSFGGAYVGGMFLLADYLR